MPIPHRFDASTPAQMLERQRNTFWDGHAERMEHLGMADSIAKMFAQLGLQATIEQFMKDKKAGIRQ